MKFIIYIVFSIYFLFSCDLTLVATNLKNDKGIVVFSLYNKDGSIPDSEFKKFYKQKFANIKNKTSTIIFKDLPKGKYAVTILHDENKNKKN